MKTIICTKYGKPEVLQIKEIEKPTPKGNEVLVKNFAITVTVADCRVRGFNVPKSFWLPARLAMGITKPRNADIENCATVNGWIVHKIDRQVSTSRRRQEEWIVCNY